MKFHNIWHESAMTGGDEELVREWGERFRGDALAARVVAGLAPRADEIWHLAFTQLQRESPEYRNAVDDVFAVESKSHCNELLRTIVAIGARRKTGADPLAFVRSHAEWRARHQVPLIASLHAYRLAHRTYWGLSRAALEAHEPQEAALRALSLLSEFWIELFDRVSDVLAEAHAAEGRRVIAQSTAAYVALIEDLLRGRLGDDPETRRLCSLCGIRPGAPIAVVIGRPLSAGNGTADDLEGTLRSLVRLIEQALPPAKFGKLVDIKEGEVRAILCSAADTARGALAALRRHGLVRGGGAGLGLSSDRNEITALPAALEEARLAIEFVSAADPLKHFADIDLPEFLIRRAASAAAFRLIPDWARQLGPEGARSAELGRTVRAFAECNLNVKQTAQLLGVHANTIYFRLNRILKLTGLDPRSYAGTTRLLTTLRLAELEDGTGKNGFPPPLAGGRQRKARERRLA